jgi:hypothetical protein
MSNDNDNIVKFGSVTGGKETKEEKGIEEFDYVIIDIDNEEWYETGFLIFTTHHVAIMHDAGPGAVPALIVPLDRVRAARLVDEE